MSKKQNTSKNKIFIQDDDFFVIGTNEEIRQIRKSPWWFGKIKQNLQKDKDFYDSLLSKYGKSKVDTCWHQ